MQRLAKEYKETERESKPSTHSSDVSVSANSKTARNNFPLPPNDRGRGPSVEFDEDDFVIDGSSPSRAVCIDVEPSYAPRPYSTKKRPREEALDYSIKRLKTNDMEIIDLTNSPPRPSRQSASDCSWRTHPQQSQSSTKTDKFTVADCSPEQKLILDLVKEGKNVFFTGSAGVGKSFVLKQMCEMFKHKGLKKFQDFFITASTGIAAVHIGGMTINSFAGVGKGEDGLVDLKAKIKRSKNSRQNWEGCKTLVIDEVSMVQNLNMYLMLITSCLMNCLISWIKLDNIFVRIVVPLEEFKSFFAETSISFLLFLYYP
jgi:hypothetical protein